MRISSIDFIASCWSHLIELGQDSYVIFFRFSSNRHLNKIHKIGFISPNRIESASVDLSRDCVLFNMDILQRYVVNELLSVWIWSWWQHWTTNIKHMKKSMHGMLVYFGIQNVYTYVKSTTKFVEIHKNIQLQIQQKTLLLERILFEFSSLRILFRSFVRSFVPLY